jgi:uncharacterized membrane-anchored protein YitT (DUF2179 family)
MRKRWVDVVFLILGSFIFALSINLFVIPNDLGEGGVTGITIIAYYIFGWSPGLVNLILNSLLLLFGFRFLGRTTTIYTVITVVFLSLFLHLTEGWNIESNEIIINVIFGGISAGVGIGLVMRVGGTTAGTAILARIMNKYFGWNISYALLFFDLIVVAASYFVIGIERVMLTVVMLYIGTKVMEYIIEGLNPKKAATIITDQPDEIAERVNRFIGRGVTVFSARGYYTKNEKDVLYIIISRQEVVKLKRIVRETDQDAFVSLHDVRDVFGEGFMDISKA